MVENTYLAHHGVKGMKWGIRRYQNADGSLTNKGKKKYLKGTGVDHMGRETYTLSRKGRKYNRKEYEKVQRYKDSTLYNVKKVDKSFDKNLEQYKKYSQNQDEFHRKEYRKYIFNQGEYKGKDKEQYKHMVGQKLDKSSEYKKVEASKIKAYNAVRRSLNKAAAQHPLYNKTYKEIDTGSPKNGPPKIKEYKIGKEVVDSIMNDIDYDIYRNRKIV